MRQIQWTGDNLKEVIAFVGGSCHNRWFKSFDEYEQYVHDHDNIFKLFMQNSLSHYEIYVGCWLEKDFMTSPAVPVTEGKYKFII